MKENAQVQDCVGFGSGCAHGQSLQLVGIWTFELFDARTGQKVLERVAKNGITNAGVNLLFSRLKDATKTPIGTLRLGDGGNTPYQDSQTALIGATQTPAKPLTSIDIDPNPANRRCSFTADFGTDEANQNISEAGLFNTDPTPVMFNRVTFEAFNKTSAQTLKVTIVITVNPTA